MFLSELATILVCLGTGIVTYLAFRDPGLRDRLLFRPEAILAHKEWHRLLGSALIHLDLQHVCINLVSLYLFGRILEGNWGALLFLGTYIGAVLGGSLLSLFIHRHHDYAALGASGGVCGVIFATIFLVPGTGVGMFFIPIYVPGPVFAFGYLVWTYFALRRSIGNIGHDAHFGGAIAGLLIALAIEPRCCLDSPLLFGATFLFAALALCVLARNPLGIPGTLFAFGRTEPRPNLRYQRYDENRERRQREADTDRILDKVSARGLDSLTPRERSILEAASAKARRE